jgi:predicted transcriptional regulator
MRNPVGASVRIFNQSVPEIGYSARTTTYGEEFDMVNYYIEHLVWKYKKLEQKRVAVFVEPQIDTGYPDIVIVEYSGTIKTKWAESRNNLTSTDLRILFQVIQQKNASIQGLSSLLGFSQSDVEKSFNRLAACNLIHLSSTGRYARNVRLQSFCNVKKVIAIEAKIDKWTDAILQASKNSWFSTESFVLLNKERCNETIIQKCETHGLGIILVNGDVKYVLKGEQRNFPVSYTSILFNEWIQRAEYLEAH